jgi:hypothetical protein
MHSEGHKSWTIFKSASQQYNVEEKENNKTAISQRNPGPDGNSYLRNLKQICYSLGR